MQLLILMLPHCHGGNAAVIVEQLREEAESLKSNGIRITTSFGVAQFPTKTRSCFEDLFPLADKADYKRNENRQNRVVSKESD